MFSWVNVFRKAFHVRSFMDQTKDGSDVESTWSSCWLRGDSYEMTVTRWQLRGDVYEMTVTRWQLRDDSYEMTFTRWRLRDDVYEMTFTRWRLRDDVYEMTFTRWPSILVRFQNRAAYEVTFYGIKLPGACSLCPWESDDELSSLWIPVGRISISVLVSLV